MSDCTDHTTHQLTDDEKGILALQQARMALDNHQESHGKLVIGGRDVEQACRLYAAVVYLAKQDSILAQKMKKSFGRTDPSKLVECVVANFSEVQKSKDWLKDIPKVELEKVAQSRWDTNVLGQLKTDLQTTASTPVAAASSTRMKERLVSYKQKGEKKPQEVTDITNEEKFIDPEAPSGN